MAGRNHMPQHPDSFQGFRNGPQPVLNQAPGPMHFHPAAREEVEMQHREIQRIIAENRLIIDDNTHFQRELAAAKDEIRRLSQVTYKLQAGKEAQTRELIDRGLKLEAELHASELLREEVMHLRTEIKKLNALRMELTTQLQGLTKEVNHLQAENQQLIALRAEVEGMHKALVDARRAFEYQKNLNEQQAEQKKAMERNLISMACEIEKLRAEQMNADRRAQGIGGYRTVNGSPEMKYPDGAFAQGYHGGWGPYSNHDPPWR
ncbi:protein FLX-like 3 isoform X2 [Durio zibethinus]|nr:protein FLX-like 3 isoform X2 [Durio zibethinus]XP_022734690.1 protein FLX-like 3 isoform X2 [Durio zibethinus]